MVYVYMTCLLVVRPNGDATKLLGDENAMRRNGDATKRMTTK